MRDTAVVAYEFGHFKIDVRRYQLFKDGEPVALTRKAFELLLILIEARGRVVEKDELIEKLWPDNFVEESNLTQYVYLLRKTFGEGNAKRLYIETIPKRGYKFIAAVRIVREEDESLQPIQKSDSLPSAPAVARSTPMADLMRAAVQRLIRRLSRAPRRVILAVALLLLVLACSIAVWFLFRLPNHAQQTQSPANSPRVVSALSIQLE